MERHPDFCLYDNEKQPIKEEKKSQYAELSLKFLDMYFSDQEAAYLAEDAPNSEKESSK